MKNKKNQILSCLIYQTFSFLNRANRMCSLQQSQMRIWLTWVCKQMKVVLTLNQTLRLQSPINSLSLDWWKYEIQVFKAEIEREPHKKDLDLKCPQSTSECARNNPIETSTTNRLWRQIDLRWHANNQSDVHKLLDLPEIESKILQDLMKVMDWWMRV